MLFFLCYKWALTLASPVLVVSLCPSSSSGSYVLPGQEGIVGDHVAALGRVSDGIGGGGGGLGGVIVRSYSARKEAL